MSGPRAWSLALRLARRELRGGARGLRLVLACLALGVGAIAAVGTLRAGIAAGLAADGARLLGGDVELRGGSRPIPPAVAAWAAGRGATASAVTTLRAMLVRPGAAADADDRLLVELKAVDAAYPLYGALSLDPPGPVPDGAVALDPIVLERLGLAAGAALRLGEAVVTVAARIQSEPDRTAGPTLFGPRALVTRATLDAAALIQPGSLAAHDLRVRLAPGDDPRSFLAALRAAFPEGGFRVRTAAQPEPGIDRFLDRTSAFLTLAGLTALLVGGIGVATGVRAWLLARARSIATLRCLGATGGDILRCYLLALGMLAALGIVLGSGLGWGVASAVGGLFAAGLPVPPRLGFPVGPLALAAAYGALTAAAFALPPLGRAARIPGAALFRDAVQPSDARPGRGLLLAVGALALALTVLIVVGAEQPAFAAGFCAAAAGALLIFRVGASGLMALARWVGRRAGPVLRAPVRLGLANLHRPGTATPIMLVALGVGLSTLAAIAQIEGNLRRELTERTAGRVPNFFFLDLQSDQVTRFDALAAGLPGIEEVRRVPSLRARMVAIKGVPVDRAVVTPETAWALAGDRGLTYAATPPDGTRLVAGAWWPADYRGPPRVSLDAGLGAGWGVAPGDRITVNVLGRDLDLEVASLRAVDWRGGGLNFTLIASPGLLESAPHTHIATVRGDPLRDGAVLRAVTDAFPNVSGVRVRDALEAVAALLRRLAAALSAVGGVTVLAGLLVLAGAVAAGQAARVRDAVILKTLGATPAQLAAAWLVEFAALGAVAGALATLIGAAASWAVLRFAMGMAWEPLWGVLALSVAGCVVLTLLCGGIGTALALRVRPAALLRNE